MPAVFAVSCRSIFFRSQLPSLAVEEQFYVVWPFVALHAYAALSWQYFEQPIITSGHRAQLTVVSTVSPSPTTMGVS